MKTEEEYLKDIGLETNKDFHLSGKTIPELMKEYAKYYHQQKLEEVENVPKKELENLWVAFGNFCKAINAQQKMKEVMPSESIKFIVEWADKDWYVSQNIQYFMTGGDPNDNSFELSDKWDYDYFKVIKWLKSLLTQEDK